MRYACKSLSRRQFLAIGGLALGGLGLPQILRAENQSKRRSRHKAIIMIYLPGGPSHLDMYDLKPEAPAEIRGEFRPISTNVPGIQICEHLPKLAAMMDKFAIVRSLVGAAEQHNSDKCVSGWARTDQLQSGRPALGSVVAKLQGATRTVIPGFVGFAPRNSMVGGNPGAAGFLGSAYAPFHFEAEGSADLMLHSVEMQRFQDRHQLLTDFDRFRRDVDSDPAIRSMDAFTQQALNILTSSALAEALDIFREPVAVRERYGRGGLAADKDYAPYFMDQFLMARRLVEAGVRCVTISFGLWDTHSGNFTDIAGHGMRYSLPLLDQGLTALVQDIHDRGMQNDVSVVAWGEFGRTPRINEQGGRDHWPQVSTALLAGGGMKTGQAIGSTDRWGESVKDCPVHYQNVFATLYQNLGIDPHTVTLPDLSGRPQYLLELRDPIRELI